MANGLDETRALDHAARIRAADRASSGVRLLAGIECDIRADGSLDLVVAWTGSIYMSTTAPAAMPALRQAQDEA
jgi:hypothetical protein